MFFLKDLPSQQMVQGYAEAHGVETETIASGLAMMRRASLMIRRLESYFSEQGLSQLRFLVLIVIDREPDRDTLTVGELTERLDVAGPVVARTLRVLLEDGLIAQAKDTRDARVKHVGLTRIGNETLDALLPGYLAIIAEEMDKPLRSGLRTRVNGAVALGPTSLARHSGAAQRNPESTRDAPLGHEVEARRGFRVRLRRPGMTA